MQVGSAETFDVRKMGAAIVAALALCATATAATSTDQWAGLTRAQVTAIARAAAGQYMTDMIVPPTIVMRRYWHHHEAWVIKADFSCGGGHFPTIVVWRGKKPFKAGKNAYMCSAAVGELIVCRELTVC